MLYCIAKYLLGHARDYTHTLPSLDDAILYGTFLLNSLCFDLHGVLQAACHMSLLFASNMFSCAHVCTGSRVAPS
jgi:hypothetical protein